MTSNLIKETGRRGPESIFSCQGGSEVKFLRTTACEAFPSKCWSPSDDGHHWPKQGSILLLITLLHSMEFNPNFSHML
jgi:hypothetical protein